MLIKIIAILAVMLLVSIVSYDCGYRDSENKRTK